MSPVAEPLFQFDDADVIRPDGGVVLHRLTWTVRERETWAITGPMASGKSTLAEAILGRHRSNGDVRWPLLDRLRAAGRRIAWPCDVIRLVGFREDSRLFAPARHYYQQRYNFVEPNDDLPLHQFLAAGGASPAEVGAVAGLFDIEALLPLSFLKLSHGQTRRARVAQALLYRPEFLILDEPFLGLDPDGQAKIGDILGRLALGGTRLLLITRSDAIPDWVTHVLELDGGAIRRQGPRELLAPPNHSPREAPLRPETTDCQRTAFHSLSRTGSEEEEKSTAALRRGGPGERTTVLELRNVTVSYDGRRILDGVSWTVHAGEKWAVLGPNGAGKSTLLSLLCGDHPQAYSNDIRLFGRKRGSGESIWEIKRRVGLVSPELHVYFTEPLTAERVAAGGFSDTLTPRPTTTEQDAVIRALFAEFGIGDLAARWFGRLSTGQQRLVLLVRALVKQPPLLILDEPFQGLDPKTAAHARRWLESRLQPEQTLIFVTHRPDEIPKTVTQRLHLEEGRAR